MDDSSGKSIFGGKVRVRVCGILIKNNSVLLLKHEGIGPAGHLWSPPGGGVEFSEDAESTLVREVKEETGLHVSVGEFLFINEYMDDYFHAYELFFKINLEGGNLKLGTDPELNDTNQILKQVKWLDLGDIKRCKPETLHNAFHDLTELNEILRKRGFFKFANISIK